jgi:hypothetical protein
MTNKARIWLLLLICLALGGCATMAAPTVALPKPSTESGVFVSVDGLLYNAGDIMGISGVAKNITASDLQSCTIFFDVLDSSGAKVATASDTTIGLKAGQVWRFQAVMGTVASVPVVSIELGSVTVQ